MTIVAGPAGAPAIVFVHGTRLTGAMWSAQQAALADEFRTIAVDLPAHGSREAEPFTLDAAAAAVDDAIGTEAAGRAVVVGLSLGGYVASRRVSAGSSCLAPPPNRSGSGCCRTSLWPPPWTASTRTC